MEQPIPFRGPSLNECDPSVLLRAKRLVAFINPLDMVPTRNVVDMGDPNFVSRYLSFYYQIPITQIYGFDFNEVWFADHHTPQRIDTVIASEVVEHLMNPLFFVRGLRNMLRPGGTLYISTPKKNPFGFWCSRRDHFTEYLPEKMEVLLRHSGFEPTDYTEFRMNPVPEAYLAGAGPFRGTLRILTQKSQLWRAAAK